VRVISGAGRVDVRLPSLTIKAEETPAEVVTRACDDFDIGTSAPTSPRERLVDGPLAVLETSESSPLYGEDGGEGDGGARLDIDRLIGIVVWFAANWNNVVKVV